MICLARYSFGFWTGELNDSDRESIWRSLADWWGPVDRTALFPNGHTVEDFTNPDDPDPRLVIMNDGTPEFGGCPSRFKVNVDEVVKVMEDDPIWVGDWCGDFDLYFPKGSPDSGAYDRGVALGLSAWSPSTEEETILHYEMEAVGLDCFEDGWTDIVTSLIKIHEADFKARDETPIRDPRRRGWSHMGFVHFDGIMVLDGEMHGDNGGWWGEPDWWAVFELIGVLGRDPVVQDGQVSFPLVTSGHMTGPDLLSGTPVIIGEEPRRSILDHKDDALVYMRTTAGHAGHTPDPDRDPPFVPDEEVGDPFGPESNLDFLVD